MSLKKAKVNGVIYDIITLEEYYNNPDMYSQYTAIQTNEGYILPIRSGTPNRNHPIPGCYPTDVMYFIINPDDGNKDQYSSDNVINFRDASNLRELIQAQQKLMNEERSILTTINNVFAPEVGANDTPEMKALKEAICDKHIDLDQYESRFGPNYNNDKRLLRKPNITFGKLRAMCDALDISATLTLEDASSDVPNPIGRTITVKITRDGNDILGEEDDE